MRFGDDSDVSPWMAVAVVATALGLWRALAWLAGRV